MSIATELTKLNTYVKDAYQALQENGYYLPDQKNVKNIAATIRREFRPPIDPDNPTISNLLLALQTDNPASYYPVGTEIPDTYAGNSNPLIVAQYLNSTNNSKYGGAEGVILVRKYVEPTSQQFGSNSAYASSAIKTFLDGTYLNNCSADLKAAISEINIPYYNGSNMTQVKSKWFLMSAYEVCNQGYNGIAGYEGVMWDYWKQKTGLSSPDTINANNAPRIMTERNGIALRVWLRSYYSSSRGCSVDTQGAVNYGAVNYGCGVCPACFLAKP